MALVCKNYRNSKRRLALSHRELERLGKRLTADLFANEESLIRRNMDICQEQISETLLEVERFEFAVRGLEEDERQVIYQLYAEGKKWTEITDRHGKVIDKKDVMNIRKKAIRHMARIESMRPGVFD